MIDNTRQRVVTTTKPERLVYIKKSVHNITRVFKNVRRSFMTTTVKTPIAHAPQSLMTPAKRLHRRTEQKYVPVERFSSDPTLSWISSQRAKHLKAVARAEYTYIETLGTNAHAFWRVLKRTLRSGLAQ